MRVQLVWLMGLSMLVAGCAESATLIGNGASMVVAVALLWSTVNLERSSQQKEQ